MKMPRLLPYILLIMGLLEMQFAITQGPASFVSRHMPAVGMVLSPQFFRGFCVDLEIVTLVCAFVLFIAQFASRPSRSQEPVA